MRFWRDRGGDGFRIDLMTSLLANFSLKDNPTVASEVQEKVSGKTFVPYA